MILNIIVVLIQVIGRYIEYVILCKKEASALVASLVVVNKVEVLLIVTVVLVLT